VSIRRFDRHPLRNPRPPPGDRILVCFRLPLLLLVAVTSYGVIGLPDRADETNALKVLLTAEG
jgi:hypothetical protein